MTSEITFEVKKTEKIHFKPHKRRNGRAIPVVKTINEIKTSLFSEPLIITSDLHEAGLEAFYKIDELYNLEKYHVITAGDMSGTETRGEDGYSTELYEYILSRAKSFYFVQGNHDLPSKNNKELYLENSDGSKAMLQDGVPVKSPYGTIIGVNGIMSRKKHPYKVNPESYLELVEKALQKMPYIFVTHETPEINLNGYLTKGKPDLYALIMKYKPKIHIYGHCYHEFPIMVVNGVTFINAEARINIFTPLSMNEALQNNKQEYNFIYTTKNEKLIYEEKTMSNKTIESKKDLILSSEEYNIIKSIESRLGKDLPITGKTDPISFGLYIEDGKVVGLNLSRSSLTSIPIELEKLKNLEILYIENCSIKNLPSEICNITNLKILGLDRNNISELPANFGNLVNLESFTIERNRIKYLPSSFTNLKNLRTLSLYRNFLKRFPSDIDKLRNLKTINATYNDLTELPGSITKLTNLEVLKVFNNKFTSFKLSERDFKNLKELDAYFAN